MILKYENDEALWYITTGLFYLPKLGNCYVN